MNAKWLNTMFLKQKSAYKCLLQLQCIIIQHQLQKIGPAIFTDCWRHGSAAQEEIWNGNK